MRFECNCKTDAQFTELLDAVHEETAGFNFEIAARLWYTPEGAKKSIMVELQVATRECRDLTENEDEPDWLTAYEVEDENEYDCSKELASDFFDSSVTFTGLMEAMLSYAEEVAKACMLQQEGKAKAPLAQQIQCASNQAARSTHNVNSVEREI